MITLLPEINLFRFVWPTLICYHCKLEGVWGFIFISFGVLALYCFIDFSGCPKHRSIDFLMVTSSAWVVCSVLQFVDGSYVRGRFRAFLVRFCARKYLADVFGGDCGLRDVESLDQLHLNNYVLIWSFRIELPTKMHLLRVVWCSVWAWYSFLLFWFWVHHDYHRSFLSMIFDT